MWMHQSLSENHWYIVVISHDETKICCQKYNQRFIWFRCITRSICARDKIQKKYVIIYVAYGFRTTSSHMTCHTWEINNKLIDKSPLFLFLTVSALQQQTCRCSLTANSRVDESSHIWCFRLTLERRTARARGWTPRVSALASHYKKRKSETIGGGHSGLCLKTLVKGTFRIPIHSVG